MLVDIYKTNSLNIQFAASILWKASIKITIFKTIIYDWKP